MANLSEYVLSLNNTDKDRYITKLTLSLDGEDYVIPDPYNLEYGWYVAPDKLPPTEYKDIYNYLIKTPGLFTGKALESFKSLDAYNCFVCGLVKEVRQNDIGDACPVVCVKACVQPGQRVTELPFETWLCDECTLHLYRWTW
jgi:hypothetical protein